MNFRLALLILFCACIDALAGADAQQRAQELQDYLSREKPNYEEREAARLGLIEQLDQLNQNQNQVRNRITEILGNRQELQMALDNLAMEVQRHRELEKEQEQKLLGILKLVNRIRREGAIRFALSGNDLGDIANRLRVVFRTLRMHAVMSNQIEQRAQRLAESELKLNEARQNAQVLLLEMQEQQKLLEGFLLRKKELLSHLNKKQGEYLSAAKEWKRVSQELNQLFQSLESDRGTLAAAYPRSGTLALPVEAGRLVRTFGRQVHPKFKTVTFHKGLEIEAEHKTPVRAVLDGVVEFEGWVKGLGNVVIVHHGGGFYSLHAHLYQTAYPQGTKVQKGEIIGLVGDTGNNDRPSLYFELRENGKAVDPSRYFSKIAMKSLSGAT